MGVVNRLTNIMRIHLFDEEPWHDILRRKGWITKGYQYEMVCKLPPPELNLKLPEGFIVRQMRCDEDKEIVEVINEAYEHERIRGSLIENMKARYTDWTCDFCWLIEKNGEIASVVVSRPRQEYIDYFGIKRGYVGPIGTRPKYQGMGLATYLTHHVLKFYTDLGYDEVSLWVFSSTPNAIRIYERLGFVKINRVTNYDKVLEI